MSSSPSRVTLRGKTSRHGVSLSGKSSNAGRICTPSIPTPADGMAGFRARPSRGAEFRGAARGHRPGGPEPDRGERGEPRAARDIRPCGARVPPETERAILLPAAGETALGPEAAVPREATRRRPPRDLDPRPRDHGGRPISAVAEGAPRLLGRVPPRRVPGLRLSLRPRRQGGSLPL